jgi:hypothetical protein
MTDDKSRIAALEREVAALKAKAEPPPKSTFVPMTDAEHFDKMHALAERRMSQATPPSVVRDLTVLDDNLCAGIRGDRHAPTSARGMIPTQPATGDDRGAGTGYVDPRPLGPPPGIEWVDAQLIADEVRQRAELKRKLGG